MGHTVIDHRKKKPFTGIAGNFDVRDDQSVRGVALPVHGSSLYVSLHKGAWRYWKGRDTSKSRMVSFSQAVGHLIPLTAGDYLNHLNQAAPGPITGNKLFSRPDGQTFIYDLEDAALVERFAGACVVGEALAASEKVLLVRHHDDGETTTEAVRAVQDALPTLNVNLALWGLAGEEQSLVLFPDCVLLRRKRWQWVVPWEEVAVEMRTKRQLDTQKAPSDVARLDRDGDGHADDGLIRYGEIVLALNEQRVLLQVSNPIEARRAAEAIAKLITHAREGRKRARPHLAPGPRRPRRKKPERAASCAQIVVRERGAGSPSASGRSPKITIRPKGEAAPPAEESSPSIVIRLRTGDAAAEAEAPPPDVNEGLETPEPPEEEANPDELVFLDEAPGLSDESGFTLRGGVGTLLAYVAKADDHFSAEEQEVVRDLLDLPAGFDLEREYEEVGPGSVELDEALERLAALPHKEREMILIDCERVAGVGGGGGQAETHLAEIKIGLGL